MSVESTTNQVSLNQGDMAPKEGEEGHSASKTETAEAEVAGKEAGDPEAGKAQAGGFHIDFPDGGLRSWLVVLGAMIVMGCSFGYLSAFG